MCAIGPEGWIITTSGMGRTQLFKDASDRVSLWLSI